MLFICNNIYIYILYRRKLNIDRNKYSRIYSKLKYLHILLINELELNVCGNSFGALKSKLNRSVVGRTKRKDLV